MRRIVSCALLAVLFAGCGGGSSHAVLPSANGDDARLGTQAVATGPNLVAINAGGPATADFSADRYYTGYSGANADPQPVDVSALNSAAAALYATYRTAPKTLTYQVTGLAANGTYSGFLFFEEPLLGGAGRRVMNVSAGGSTVAIGFDIFAMAGKTHKAVALPFTASANASGVLAIVLTATVNDAIISGFRFTHAGGTVTASDVEVNAGGPTIDAWAGDRYYAGYSGTNADANPIDVSAPNAAPAYVYASYRTAPNNLTYTVTGLVPGASYQGFLHFDEPLLGGVGLRVQNVSAGGHVVVQGLDIFKIAGKTHKAVVVPMTATADASGTIPIVLTATANDTIISGFELHEVLAATFTRFSSLSTQRNLRIIAGPDGAMWFTAQGPSNIGRIAPDGSITYFPLPAPAYPAAITVGPDGALWFTDTAGFIGRITTAGAVMRFPVAHSPFAAASIVAGPDGALWFTEEDAIGRMTTSGALSEFPIPTKSSATESITNGPDGALWFGEVQGQKIGRITTGGAITEYQFIADVFNVTIGNPESITAGPDGNLWFGDVSHNTVDRITTAGSISEFPVPQGFPDYIASGPDGALWFCNYTSIDRITTTGVVTNVYPIPPGATNPQSLTQGPNRSLWFTDGASSGIYRFAIP